MFVADELVRRTIRHCRKRDRRRRTSGLPFARALTPLQVSPQATEGACTAEEDVYYCGGDACDICDYAF